MQAQVRRFGTALVISGLTVLPGGCSDSPSVPQTPATLAVPWAACNFDSTRYVANALGRPLIVNATADWCGPCTLMDAQTWSDPELVTWIWFNAVPFRLELGTDNPLHCPSVGRVPSLLGAVRAIPTVYIVRADTVVAKVVGYRTAGELLRWLDDYVPDRRTMPPPGAGAGN